MFSRRAFMAGATAAAASVPFVANGSPSVPDPKDFMYWRPWLYPKQEAAIFNPRDRDGNPARYGLIEASTKTGKAQPLDALVYTPSGPVRMGDIQLGQEVLVPDGGRARVVGIYPQGLREIYRVTFSDRTSVEVDGDHLWEVHNYFKAPRVLSTKDVSDLLEKGNRSKRERADIWLPKVEPVDFEERPVPLDPYVVGLLIGDGSLSGESLAFSTKDFYKTFFVFHTPLYQQKN